MFEKIKVKSLKYKTSELPDKKQGEFVLPVLTAGIQNQGLNNFVPRKNATILKNVISVSANGANTGATFYQKEEFTVLQDAYAVEWIDENFKLSDNQYLYLVSSISKTIYGNYEWTNKAGWEKIKDNKISLPTKNGEMDFEFMESFVAAMEAEKIKNLDTYLEENNLKDYTLTTEEKQVLEDFESGKFEWGEIQIGQLFEKLSLKFLKKTFDKENDISREKTLEFNLPLVNAKNGNNGIMYYGKVQDFENAEMCIDIVNDGAISTVNVYPQPQKTGVLYNAFLVKPKFNNSKKLLHFFASAMQKSIKLKFGYDNKAGWIKVKEEKISLPIKNSQPDYEKMEILISAIQKMVVKDVVLYVEGKLFTNRFNK